MRNISVNVVTNIKMRIEDNVDVDEVISEMDYNFTSTSDGVTFDDTEIRDYEEIDLDEQTRRDEKHGLYPDKIDIAN